jgi:predicted dehydrogenase
MTQAAPAPLPIAIVGLNFGRHIIDQLLQEPANRYFRLTAVCDLDAEKADEFGTKHGVKAYHNLEDLLADETIPVIGLYTGPAGRAGLLRQILDAGKDIMTTKPFELDPDAARRILEEARDRGKIIHLNSPSPETTGYMKQITAWREKYDLGRPVHCRGEVVVSYREQEDGRWLDDPERCPVAPIFRLGIYIINDLTRLFGGVREVQVQSSRLFTGRPTPDNAQLSMLFADGAIGSIFATFCVDNGQYYANSLILHFERGTIYRNMRDFPYGQASGTSHLRLVTTDGQKNVVTDEWVQTEGAGGYQWDVLHEAILSRDVTSMPIEDTVHGIQVIEAMARAEKSCRTEAVQHTS